MKKPVIFKAALILALPIVLFTGYYETRYGEEDEDKFVFFIKKAPTLKFRFVNIFATESEDRDQLYKVDRQYAIDYCKYYLGIEIEMKTQKEMDTFKRGYYATFKRKPLNYIDHESWGVETE